MASEAHAKAPPGGAPLCNDEGRVLFYERVGRYFYDDSEVVAFEAPLPCITCGKPLSAGALIDGRAICAPQRAIVAKRRGHEDPAPEDDVPGVKQRFSQAFNSPKKAVFVTPSAAYVITAVRPVSPLPDDLTWRTAGTNEAYGELYGLIFGQPLETPALYVEFGQNGSAEFALTESSAMLLRCGGTRVETIDTGRVREILAAGEAVGLDGLRRFNSLRGRSLRGDALKEAEESELLDLLRRIVAAGIDPASPPNPDEGAYAIAGTILKAAA